MARKPEAPPRTTAWTIYKVAAKQTRLGEVEATDEREAVEKAAKELGQHCLEADRNAAGIGAELAAGTDFFGLLAALLFRHLSLWTGVAEEITMIDADGSSPFNRPAPRLRDLDTDDLDRLAASLHHIALCCCEPVANDTDERLLPDAVAMDKHFLVDAMPAAGEQL